MKTMRTIQSDKHFPPILESKSTDFETYIISNYSKIDKSSCSTVRLNIETIRLIEWHRMSFEKKYSMPLQKTAYITHVLNYVCSLVDKDAMKEDMKHYYNHIAKRGINFNERDAEGIRKSLPHLYTSEPYGFPTLPSGTKQIGYYRILPPNRNILKHLYLRSELPRKGYLTKLLVRAVIREVFPYEDGGKRPYDNLFKTENYQVFMGRINRLLRKDIE